MALQCHWAIYRFRVYKRDLCKRQVRFACVREHINNRLSQRTWIRRRKPAKSDTRCEFLNGLSTDQNQKDVFYVFDKWGGLARGSREGCRL